MSDYPRVKTDANKGIVLSFHIPFAAQNHRCRTTKRVLLEEPRTFYLCDKQWDTMPRSRIDNVGNMPQRPIVDFIVIDP